MRAEGEGTGTPPRARPRAPDKHQGELSVFEVMKKKGDEQKKQKRREKLPSRQVACRSAHNPSGAGGRDGDTKRLLHQAPPSSYAARRPYRLFRPVTRKMKLLCQNFGNRV